MKKKLLFIFAVLTLRGLPQSGKIDTLYYLRSNYLFPEYYHTIVHCAMHNLSLQSPVSTHQTLKVYDVLGNEIAVLVDEYKPTRSYEVEFQSTVGNLQLASGVYYYQLRTTPNGGQAGEFVQTKKMILIR